MSDMLRGSTRLKKGKLLGDEVRGMWSNHFSHLRMEVGGTQQLLWMKQKVIGGFEQRKDINWCTFWQHHSGYCLLKDTFSDTGGKGKNLKVTEIIQVRDDGGLNHSFKFRIQPERKYRENRGERSQCNPFTNCLLKTGGRKWDRFWRQKVQCM